MMVASKLVTVTSINIRIDGDHIQGILIGHIYEVLIDHIHDVLN